MRDPFADSELVSFMLSIPAYALYNEGASKLVLRRAMAHMLPSALLARPTRSDISPLFRRGIGPGRPPSAFSLLERADAFWGRYVKPDVFLEDDAQQTDKRISGARSVAMPELRVVDDAINIDAGGGRVAWPTKGCFWS
ncbi:MAG: hypothetical protein IPL60_10010 [Ardenticatenia bacterium]|nr:hypothetical protein [Ardenticatenia bacterium]